MKKIKIITIILLTIFMSITSLDAASFGITSSTTQVAPNQTFTINVGGDCIGRVDLKVSNGTLSTSSIWVEQGYISVTVTAGSSGIVTVTASPVTGFSDADANLYNPGSKTITVNINSNTGGSGTTTPTRPSTTTPKSSDNNLSSLTTNMGELSPIFDKNQTEYKIDLKKDATTITIDAKASDSKAKIDGLGEHAVRPGNNEINVTVTAENGNTKTYKIVAYVDETPEVYLNYEKEKIGIIRNYEGVEIPEEFTMNEHKIDDKSVTTFTKDKISIIYGINEKNEKDFYVINTITNEITNKIKITNINGKTLYIIEDSKSDKITINELEISCQKIKNTDNYCILKTINSDELVIDYLYEKTENGIIKYTDFTNNDNTKTKNIILYIISAILVLSISLNIYLLYKEKRGGSHEKTK